jgi:hypothetical protein
MPISIDTRYIREGLCVVPKLYVRRGDMLKLDHNVEAGETSRLAKSERRRGERERKV